MLQRTPQTTLRQSREKSVEAGVRELFRGFGFDNISVEFSFRLSCVLKRLIDMMNCKLFADFLPRQELTQTCD